ncbi:MAG: alanine racemase [Myxococcales bacterium]|nr:MAG: alanine racemase [Myxococcales bacterium]
MRPFLSPSQPLARIDLAALAHNYSEVRRLVGRSVSILAMVKADAYGHGSFEVAGALSRQGCTTFGVATLAEARAIRLALPDARVVVFGGLCPDDAQAAVASGVEIVVSDIDVVMACGAAAAAAGTELAVHVKIDTGMRRLGVEPRDAVDFVKRIRSTRGTRPAALCSHFALAESVTTEVTDGQVELLQEAARAVAERGPALPCHLANSAGILTRPASHLDMVRPGLMLYGLYPDTSLAGHASLRPVMTLEGGVVRVAGVGPGEGIGYGHTFRTERPTRVATLRCGYADGYPRALSNRGVALLGDRRVPVLGRVCMDHVMVDVTELDDGDVEVGTRMILWGPGLDAGEVAALADTISYELVARVGRRVDRVYEEAS